MKGQGSAFNQAAVIFLSKGTKMMSSNYIFLMYENPCMIASDSVFWVNEDVSVFNLAVFSQL